jgi:hypothetical protein
MKTGEVEAEKDVSKLALNKTKFKLFSLHVADKIEPGDDRSFDVIHR